MARWAAFLRGMNLGTRRVKNPELAAIVAGEGFTDVAVLRASGNVIFDAPAGARAAELTGRLETALARDLGYPVVVFVRSAAQVRAIAAHEPFPAGAVAASNGKLQVSLLARKPSAPTRKAVLAMATEQDPLDVNGSELYWLPSGGLLESHLDLNAIDKLLGASTRRTMGTIQLIAAKHCD
jgi:uncharacterized protein (DUF1697 family)